MTTSSQAKRRAKRAWFIPLGLVLVSLIPVLAGSVRVAQLASGIRTPDDARFFVSPTPVVAHIVCASFFCVLGAIQLAPALRWRWPNWHRQAGRVLAGCGVVAGISGTWMTLFYPHVPGDTWVLFGLRVVLGPALVLCMLRGFHAARSGRLAEHRRWMMRGYAIGMGAGTQAILHIPFLLTSTRPGEVGRTILMAAGWAINLLIAEWLLRRRSPASAGASRARLEAGRTDAELLAKRGCELARVLVTDALGDLGHVAFSLEQQALGVLQARLAQIGEDGRAK